MNRLYLLPLLLSVTLVTGCDFFDGDDNKKRPPAAGGGEIGFTELFDEAFARDPNGEPSHRQRSNYRGRLERNDFR